MLHALLTSFSEIKKRIDEHRRHRDGNDNRKASSLEACGALTSHTSPRSQEIYAQWLRQETPGETPGVTHHHQVVRELRTITKSYGNYAPSSSRTEVTHHHQVVCELRTTIIKLRTIIKSYVSYVPSSIRTGIPHHRLVVHQVVRVTHHQVVRGLRTIINSYGNYAPPSIRTGITHHHLVVRTHRHYHHRHHHHHLDTCCEAGPGPREISRRYTPH